MDNYIIDEIDLNAINRILDIYNSNKSFLCNHLGVSSVSKEFILNEIEEMKKIGFNSSIIKFLISLLVCLISILNIILDKKINIKKPITSDINNTLLNKRLFFLFFIPL